MTNAVCWSGSVARIWGDIQVRLRLHLEEVEEVAVRVDRASGHPPLHCIADESEDDEDVVEPTVCISQHLTPRHLAIHVALGIHQ